jgi:hypothetical protein
MVRLTRLFASTPGKRFTMFLISSVCFTRAPNEEEVVASSQGI